MKTIHPSRCRAAFSLVELLAVMAIIALLAAFAAPALSVITGNEVNQAIYTVSDTLDEARAYAMSKNTYVYVGLLQDSGSNPGSMVIGVVASSDGTQMFSTDGANLTSSSFTQISRVLKLENIRTVSLPSSDPTGGVARQTVSESYRLGDPAFGAGVSPVSFALGSYIFDSSAAKTTAPGVVSEGMLQIDPQGVVSEVGGDSVPFFEIGLQAINGKAANYAAIQVAGLSGAVRIYRP